MRAGGDPFARGFTVGGELQDLITASLGFYRRYLDRRGVSPSRLEELLRPHLAAAEAATPDFVETMKGMSTGAMVPFPELFAVNAFEELEPLVEPESEPGGGSAPAGRAEGGSQRCSAFAVSGPGYALLAHNENWLAGDVGNVAVVIAEPQDGSVGIASPTIACCLAAVGMNSLGGAQGVCSLTAEGDGPGVPRVLVSRHSLESSDPEDARRRTALAGRSGGYGYVLGFSGGETLAIETTASRQAVLPGPAVHTNHYLDPELARAGSAPSDGSRSRYERLRDLVEERRPTTPEDAMGILRDHESAPQAICTHADEAEGEEADAVLFSMVADLAGRRMWVAAGNPCTNAYEEVDLSGVL